MPERMDGGGPEPVDAEAVRRALIEAALRAHDDAGLSGLCAEGRWEAAVGAIRGLDLGGHPARAEGGAAGPRAGPCDEFVAAVAAPVPAPGGGSVAAVAGLLGAALVQMVAGLTAGRPRYRAVDAPMRDALRDAAALGTELAALAARDADAYSDVAAAYALPSAPEAAAAVRGAAIERALVRATEVPLEIARAAAEVAELAALGAERGNVNAVSDAAVAALLAEAACRGAGYAVRVNVAALRGGGDGESRRGLADEAMALAEHGRLAATRAAAAVERACS